MKASRQEPGCETRGKEGPPQAAAMQWRRPLTLALSPSDGARESVSSLQRHPRFGEPHGRERNASLSPYDGERVGVRGCSHGFVTSPGGGRAARLRVAPTRSDSFCHRADCGCPPNTPLDARRDGGIHGFHGWGERSAANNAKGHEWGWPPCTDDKETPRQGESQPLFDHLPYGLMKPNQHQSTQIKVSASATPYPHENRFLRNEPKCPER